jgi:hypothetical protein
LLALLNQRDLLSNAREKAPFTERAALTERISAVSQEIAAMLGPERKPPTAGASWA